MSRSKRARYESERQRIQDAREAGDIPPDDADLIFEFLDAKDPQVSTVVDPDDGTKSDGTLARYTNCLHRVSRLAEFNLSAATADELNQLMDDMRAGRVDDVKDGGLSAGSVKNFQSVLRKFYEYHADLGIEKAEIALANPDNNTVDERDLFDKEEIHAIRNAASHPRDKALVDLLFYTGQRLSAVLNLRLRDINLEDATFYLNEEAGDLKGADGKRPLLYAEKAVRDWYNAHPCNDPDDHFITHKYEWENKPYSPGERLDSSTVYRQLQRIGERAGVEKPMNAHNFRHTFVTVCKRNYGMDNDTIKRLIGHRPDSNIMETTYSHLTDDDVIAAAERSVGLRDDEPDSPLTPEVCDVCGEPVASPNAKACHACGATFTPDAVQATKSIQQDVGAEKVLAELGESGELTPEQIEQLANDDALMAELIQARAEREE